MHNTLSSDKDTITQPPPHVVVKGVPFLNYVWRMSSIKK